MILGSALLEEVAQKAAGFLFQNASLDDHLMIEARMIEHMQDRTGCPGFWIACGVDQAVQAGMNHCAGAHGAGLKRDVELAVSQAIIAERLCRGAQGDDLGMSGWVEIAQDSVLSARDDFAVVNDYGSDGDFPFRRG